MNKVSASSDDSFEAARATKSTDFDVSIVIPNFEGREILPRTMSILHAVLQKTSRCCETVVVDDCSTDASVEFLKTENPWARVVELPQNLGFSGASNNGASVARAPLLYFMNSDVYPREGFLDSLVDRFKRDHDLFAAMSLSNGTT